MISSVWWDLYEGIDLGDWTPAAKGAFAPPMIIAYWGLFHSDPSGPKLLI